MRSSGSMRAQIGTLILATSAIQLANGFFGTLISLRVAVADFEATMAGLVLSSYFAGFTLGALRTGRIIERVGHIRAYAAFAGMAVAATAAMPLLIGPVPWIVLRAVVGFGCAGVFITTESWLNAKARSEERGRVQAGSGGLSGPEARNGSWASAAACGAKISNGRSRCRGDGVATLLAAARKASKSVAAAIK